MNPKHMKKILDVFKKVDNKTINIDSSKLVSYGKSVLLTYDMDLNVEIEGTLDIQKLLKIMPTLKEFNPSFSAGKIKLDNIKLPVRPMVELPKFKPKDHIVTFSGKFKEDLNFVAKAMSGDYTKVSGVLIDEKNTVATDGHRLHLAAHGLCEGELPQKLFIPSEAVKVLQAMLNAYSDQVIFDTVGSDWYCVSVGMNKPFKLFFKAKPEFTKGYPPYNKIIPSDADFQWQTKIEVKELQKCLKQAFALFYRKMDQQNTHASIEKNSHLRLVDTNPDNLDQVEIECKVLATDDEMFNFNIALDYVRDALIGEAVIMRNCNPEDLKPVKFSFADELNNKSSYIMPLRP